ncbi:DUF2147 domain-containing protein [uncultured Paracoccus sp.]|uniref:DUF2147 domain-containing protein n=1 Tax=uncultured Paracoccus sp. TaxID=189685 RepID=UPI00262DC87D|nr:DUF2147 domain-containing protein [uncultured Paracoccus sp.]
MKTFALAAAFALAAVAAHADPIEGVWQTQPDDGAFAHVTIAPCGNAYCGTITRAFKDKAEYASPNVGKQIVRSMVAKGDGNYEGQVWRPANDKVYNGKATVSGNQMSLAGCVAGGLICKSQTWVKIQ